MGTLWICLFLILAVSIRYGQSLTCAYAEPVDIKERVYMSPIVILAEVMGTVRLEGYPLYRDPWNDPWGFEDYGLRYQIKVLCIFKHYGAPALESDLILVDYPGPCSEGT